MCSEDSSGINAENELGEAVGSLQCPGESLLQPHQEDQGVALSEFTFYT